MSALKNVDLSRRSFVTGAALAAGAAGVAGAVSLAHADEVTWDGTYDVIVCGGGGSGLTAAYSALEQGAEKVLVLEKGDTCGGTTATAEGAVQASGTTWQKELGANGVDDDSADKHYAFWMQDGEGLVDPDLVRVMADNAADNLQWMADSFGITYSKVFGCYPAAYTDPANMADRIHLITDAADATKTGGVVWTTNAEAAVRDKGGEIMTGTAAAHLVMGDDGVAGVETADGKHYQATKGVVLAMSGIEHNEELAKKYNPQQYWDLKTQAVATAATDTGDGIVMGIEAGADVGRFGGAVDLLLATWSYTNNTNPEIPYILVNQRGVRFVREDTTYAFHCRAIYNACIQEGGFDDEAGTTGCTWMVMDNKMTSVSQAAWSDPDKLQEALDDGSMVTGQTIEAVILGTLVLLGMLILRLPYAPVIAVLVGVTALIPILGSWIGAIVGALLILPVSFMQAIWFVVFLIVLQQIEGNLIYPHVVGKSVGLPGIWVFFAVIVGSGLGGVAGMLLGVPVCAVIYDEVRRAMRKKEAALTASDNDAQ